MFLIFILSFQAIAPIFGLKYSTVDSAFYKGFEAYSGERWSECIVQFEEALHLYKLHKSVVTNCRLQCSNPQYESLLKDNLDDLQMYEKVFKIRNCLTNCQDKGFDDLHIQRNIDDSTLSKMILKKPYEYLHICYFQMYALPKAASAAYTFLVANPEDDQMKKNLEYYIQQSEVDKNEVVDLESEDYKVLFNIGVKAYNKGNWQETIAAMEEVLTDYLSSENTCRMECEQQPEQQWISEFFINLSNNIASLIQCKQQCQDKLKAFRYNSGIEFLAEVLNYLQISYYRLDRIEEAASAAASYLILMPEDEEMIHNKNIYSTLINNKEAFTPRSEIEYYLKRNNYETIILDIFHKGNYDIDSNSI